MTFVERKRATQGSFHERLALFHGELTNDSERIV